MNYLLFGGSGFIGEHLCKILLKRKNEIPLIFDIKDSKLQTSKFERVDVRQPIKTSYVPSEKDIIVNLAAVHRTPGHPSKEYYETNLLGAENVCNYARRHGVKTIVFTSSIAAYGTYEAQKNEDTIPRPDIPYGISKLSAEYIHKIWQKEDPENRRLIILRPGVVFGEFEKGNFTRLINSIARKRFFYPGRKDTIKACIYVKDLVYAIVEMIGNESVGEITYNMTYEPAPSIEKICNVISEKGRLSAPKVKFPSIFLIVVSKVLYSLTQKEGIHPERVRKLLISNNISGKKLNSNYKLKYGLDKGIIDWMDETNFFKNKEIF